MLQIQNDIIIDNIVEQIVYIDCIYLLKLVNCLIYFPEQNIKGKASQKPQPGFKESQSSNNKCWEKNVEYAADKGSTGISEVWPSLHHSSPCHKFYLSHDDK